MEKACQWLKDNSLVYDEWSPEHTDAIKFIHSQNDEVVPYVNMENMAQFLRDNGYNAFTIDDNINTNHTATGLYYARQVVTELASYDPEGAVTEVAIDSDSIGQPINVYSIDGCLLMRQVSPFDAYQQLERGIYIIGNKKVVKQ